MADIPEQDYLCLDSSTKFISEFIPKGQNCDKIFVLNIEIFDAVT